MFARKAFCFLCIAVLFGISAQYGSASMYRLVSPSEFQAGTLNGLDAAFSPGTVGLPRQEVFRDDFNYTKDDVPQNWIWDNPSGMSSFSFTARPGYLEMTVAKPEDLWVTIKNYAAMFRAEPIEGDFDAETKVELTRTAERHQGIVVWVDESNWFLAGPYAAGEVRIEGWVNDAVQLLSTGSSSSSTLWIRVTRSGDVFSAYFKASEKDPWKLLGQQTITTWPKVTVGLLCKSWGSAGSAAKIRFDHFRVTRPTSQSGEFISAPIDLRGPAKFDEFSYTGAGAKVQLRGADTAQALASAPWLGPTSESDYYPPEATRVNPALNGKRFVQIRAVLSKDASGEPSFGPATLVYNVGAEGLFSSTDTLTAPAGGEATGPVIDLGGPARLLEIEMNLRGGGSLQIRSSSTEAGLQSAPWLGPTGPDDSYTSSPYHVNPAHDGARFVQYRVLAPAESSADLSSFKLYYELISGGTYVVNHQADFQTGTFTGVDITSSPGDALLETKVTFRDEFNYTGTDVPSGWVWDNPSGLSGYSWTAKPGSLRLTVSRPEDIWVWATPKDRVRMYRSTPSEGDWYAETLVTVDRANHNNRHVGIVVWQDPDNWLLYGPYNQVIRIEGVFKTNPEAPGDATSFYNESVSNAPSVYLRVVKQGDSYTCYYRTDPKAPWIRTGKQTRRWKNITVGVMGKSWPGGAGDTADADFEYFEMGTIASAGEWISPPIDMGAPSKLVQLDWLMDPRTGVQLQIRSANTAEELQNAKWLGPTSEQDYYTGYPPAVPNAAHTGSRFAQIRAAFDPAQGMPSLKRLALSYTPLEAAPPPPPAALKGDLNGDGRVGIPDASIALRFAVGIGQPTPQQLAAGDINGNGKIDITDATKILRAAVGLERL
jgi:regulation of enolase protein 1 (concanavalin A-like superfamily)